jgi:hypothetical protein
MRAGHGMPCPYGIVGGTQGSLFRAYADWRAVELKPP